MKAKIEYKIYELDINYLKEREHYINDKEKRVCLIETRFKGWESNSFDSFESAINYLLDNEMPYRDYTILSVISVND